MIFRSDARGRRNRALTVAAAGLLAALPAACGSDTGPLESNRTPVILISIDSLRADFCSAYGYEHPQAPGERTTPFMEQMAARGTRFENASSSTSWTLPAHMSLLTGMACTEHGVRNRSYRLQEGTELLSGRFKRAGYQTGGFYSAPFLHWSWGFSQGFDAYDAASPYLKDLDAVEAILEKERRGSLHNLHDASHEDNRCSERVVDAALAWLEEDRRHEQPFFLFLHLWDPHYDYEPPPGYADRFDPGYDGPIDGRGFMADPREQWSGRDLDHWRSLYAAEIRYTDDQIARLWERITEWGLADEVILAVTSDHGDEFFEHGQKGHQKTLYEEVTHVPMLLQGPGVPAGGRVSQTICLYDLAPTLAELAGVPPWSDRTGKSTVPLLRGGSGEREAVLDLFMNRENAQMGWRRGSDKLIQHVSRKQILLFDLTADPGETSPRRLQSFEKDPLGQAARRALAGVTARPGHAGPMERNPTMDRMLEELGYTSGH